MGHRARQIKIIFLFFLEERVTSMWREQTQQIPRNTISKIPLALAAPKCLENEPFSEEKLRPLQYPIIWCGSSWDYYFIQVGRMGVAKGYCKWNFEQPPPISY